MPSTTIHIPPELLEAVDSRARAEGVSRNRFILRALQSTLEREARWSPGFLVELRRPLSKSDSEAVDSMVSNVISKRSNKGDRQNGLVP